MGEAHCFMKHQIQALKGRNIIAMGEAHRFMKHQIQALKGRSIIAMGEAHRKKGYIKLSPVRA